MPTLAEWRTFFDGWASQDQLMASTGDVQSPRDFDRLAAEVVGLLGLTGVESVLDVGCASATLTRRWAESAARVTGIDFSLPLLRNARCSKSRPFIHVAQAEAARLPFGDASFDRVCCFNVLHNLPDHGYARCAMAELLRVVRPGGRVLIGSLPDVRCKEGWFDRLDANSPWYRRAVPRRVRWWAKRVLVPGSRPGTTRILWFDIDALVAQFGAAGWHVEIVAEPDFANHKNHRRSLVLERREPAESKP